MKKNISNKNAMACSITKKNLAQATSAANGYTGISYVIYLLLLFVFAFINNLAYSQGKTQTEVTKPDNTYGAGGSVKITTEVINGSDGVKSTHTKYEYFDSQGRRHERVDSCFDDKTQAITIFHWNYGRSNNGDSLLWETVLRRDNNGREDINYQEGFLKKMGQLNYKQIYGTKTEIGRTRRYDPANDDYISDEIGWVLEQDPKKDCSFQPYEISLLANFLHTGDNYYPYGSIGGSGEVTRFIKPGLGITVDAGYYTHSEPAAELKRSFSQLNIAAGITYLPMGDRCCENKFSISTHALFGISNYTQKTIFSNKTVTNTLHSVMMDIGAGAKWKLNNEVSIVLPQIDYAPTLFGGNLQNNLRIGLGASISFGNKICYESKTEGLPMTMEKGLPTVVEEDSTDEEEMPKPPPTWSEIAIKGYDFEEQPGIYSPNDRDHQNPLNNPHRTKGKNCSGIDIFDYSNGEKPGIATLVIKNEGECKVHVKIEKLSKGNGKNKKDKNSGTTDDKNGEEKNGKGKVIGQKAFEYDVDKMPGSDVFSFKIDKETSIRVIITCGGGDGECIFTRNFSIATENETPITKEKDAPRLKVDPPSDPEQLTQYKPQGNRCTSRDSVFFKITNHDVKETMTIHFKAVTSCSCYFEVYADGNPDQPDGDPNPKEGSKVGFGDAGESEKIAKPSIKDQPAKDGTEQVLIVKSGETYYLKGRCPVQLQKSGPCNGHVEITGITFTTKKK